MSDSHSTMLGAREGKLELGSGVVEFPGLALLPAVYEGREKGRPLHLQAPGPFPVALRAPSHELRRQDLLARSSRYPMTPSRTFPGSAGPLSRISCKPGEDQLSMVDLLRTSLYWEYSAAHSTI